MDAFRESRLRGVRRLLRGIDCVLVTSLPNVRYLTGFTGSSGYALISRRHNLFVTDFRYEQSASREVEGWEIVVERKGRLSELKSLAAKLGIKRLGFEDSVTYGTYSSLSKRFNTLKAMKGAVERLREVKDAHETRSIRKAINRAERAFLAVKPRIRPGTTEKAIARRLAEAVRKEGAERLPFDIIVASGENSAMPHAKVTSRRLKPGDLVIVDWGAEADGYFSDMTRTLLMRGDGLGGKRRIYSLVRRANRAAVGRVKDGEAIAGVDGAARGLIKDAGYGEAFGHALGHGVGIEVHERPVVSGRTRGKLREGMMITVEPGIYVSGLGGVRIEDVVRVGDKGASVLTTLPRRLEIV